MDKAAIIEWSSLALRWFHVFAGILWIGATYYFTWLDHRLSEEGDVWMVHSGNFYLVQKQNSPEQMPARLHWFRYEALFTWISGFLLMGLVYYMGSTLVDPVYPVLAKGPAIGLSVGALAAGWVIYDLLCRSPLGRQPLVLAAVGYVLSVAAVWGLGHVFTARAAFFHLGAIWGTIMMLNVWMRILPAQRRAVAKIKAGQPVDQAAAAQAKLRSTHNTFLVLPVVLTMISNHYPTVTYGARYNWLVLALLILVGWVSAKLIRH
jgi:uncharacterized membrane protein